MKYNHKCQQKMDSEKLKKILQTINWDTNIPTSELECLINGKKTEVNGISREMLFLQCLERVLWHNLVPMWNGTANFVNLYTEKV